MNESELHNLFGVAESRGIDPLTVVESLYINGRQIYLHFAEEQMGIMVFDGIEESEELIEYRISAGKVYPLTPDSRVGLADALSNKLVEKELKIRIAWEDTESKFLGQYYIKVTVDLKSELVIDYKDFQFIPPPRGYEPVPLSMNTYTHHGNYFGKIENILIPGKRTPHTAYVVVAKTIMKIKRGDAWRQLGQYSDQSKGSAQVSLPGWGLIYLKRDREKTKLRYKTTNFEGPSDGETITRKAFDSEWNRA